MSTDRDILLRLLRDELPDADAERVRERLRSDSDLAAVYRRMQQTNDLLRENQADSFGPYFSERVLKRLMATATAGRLAFYDSLQWVFLRLAAACLVLVIGLGVYNALDSRESELNSTTVEAVFGLPSNDFDSLFYLQGI